LHSVDVILDVAMGGTSKDVLGALGVPENALVSVCDGLHTKLYIGAEGAVIATANASANALGTSLGGGRLEELGVWVDAYGDAEAYAQAKAEFNQIKRLSRPATQEDIDRAPTRETLRSTSWQPSTAAGSSLLALVADDPERFSDTLFIFGDIGVEPEVAQKIDRMQEGLSDDQSDFEDILILERGKTSKINRAVPYTYVLNYYWHGQERLPTLYAFHAIYKVGPDSEGYTCVFGRDDLDVFCRTHGLPNELANYEKVRRSDRNAAKQLGGPEGRGSDGRSLKRPILLRNLARRLPVKKVALCKFYCFAPRFDSCWASLSSTCTRGIFAIVSTAHG
tara:strand:+ start:514 stop:1521 length:1008 start_codon:yes stop_codon:yes gene_type:complete